LFLYLSILHKKIRNYKLDTKENKYQRESWKEGLPLAKSYLRTVTITLSLAYIIFLSLSFFLKVIFIKKRPTVILNLYLNLQNKHIIELTIMRLHKCNRKPTFNSYFQNKKFIGMARSDSVSRFAAFSRKYLLFRNKVSSLSNLWRGKRQLNCISNLRESRR
jgi:hypothetical protein